MIELPSPIGDREMGTPGRLSAILLAASVVLAGCAGGGQAVVRTAQVPSLSDALECAREEGTDMGFDVERIDREERLLLLERDVEDVERSNPSFQKAVDQLRIEAGPGPEGSDRDLEVTARTFHEHRTRKGRTRRQQAASDDAVEAADTLVDRCGSEAAAGR